MNLKELRAKLERLKKEGREKTAEYNALAERLATLEAAAREEAEAKLASLDQAITALERDVEATAAEIARAEASIRRSGLFAATPATSPARAGASRVQVIHEPGADETGGFRNLAEFAMTVYRAVVNHTADERLTLSANVPQNVHSTSGPSGEGYLVPAAFRSQIWELVFNAGDLLGLTDSEPTASPTVDYLKDESTPWGGAGVQAFWRSEMQKMDPTKVVQNAGRVELHDLYAFVLASEELLSDAPRLNARITTKAAQAIRWTASDAIMWGDGRGKPLGFMNAPALVTVGKESGQGAGTLAVENIAKMYSRMLMTNLSGTVWLGNSDILPQLITMTIGTVPVYTPPSSGISGAPGGFVLGRPILWTEHAHSIGNRGDLAFVDLMGYYNPVKNTGIEFAESIHLYFDYNLRAFRWTFRMGGQPYLSKPVSPARGSATKSHFVVLEDRLS